MSHPIESDTFKHNHRTYTGTMVRYCPKIAVVALVSDSMAAGCNNEYVYSTNY